MRKLSLLLMFAACALLCKASNNLKSNPSCNANITVSASADSVCSGIVTYGTGPGAVLISSSDPVTITASGGVSYSWSTGSTNDTIRPTTAGTYTVTGTDANGCTGTASITIYAEPGYNMTLFSSIGNNSLCSLPVNAGQSAIVNFAVSFAGAGGGQYRLVWTATGGGTILPTNPYVTTNASGSMQVYFPDITKGGTVIVAATPINISGQSIGCTKIDSAVIPGCPCSHYYPIVGVAPATICAGNSARLTTSGAATSYLWSTGATTNSISVSPAATATYTITGSFVPGSAGSCSQTTTATVTVVAPKTLSITPSSVSYCSGSNFTPVQLNASAGFVSYQWSNGDNNSFTEDVTGQLYTLTAIDSNGCSATDSVPAATVIPAPTISINASNSTICSGSSTTLTASGATTYIWSDGETTSSITVSPLSTTVYSVSGTNAQGCTASATTQITVEPNTIVTCANAISLPTGNFFTDYYFQPCSNTAWFSFVADSAKMILETTSPISSADSGFSPIDSLAIYSGPCGGLNLVSVAIDSSVNPNDSLPGVQLLNLVPGNTYYVKVTRRNSFKTNSLAYFGLRKAILPKSVIPVCTISACDGTNLICNGSFDNAPAWVGVAPYGLGGPIGYMDNSFIYPARPLVAGNPPLGYCINSSDMRYAGGLGGTKIFCGTLDYTDIYMITQSIGGGFNNNPHSAPYFMAVDCPSNNCTECSTSACAPTLPTPGYTCNAWQQNVAVIPGVTYVFNVWLQYMDVGQANGATVNITVNGPPNLFSDQIIGATYANWHNVCFNWTAPIGVVNANILITGMGAFNPGGYDFKLDDISFQVAQLPAITAAASPSTICVGSSTTLSVTPANAGITYTWSPATGLSSTTGATVTATPTVTTVYTVTESIGTCTATATCTVTVNSTPTVMASPAVSTICAGTSTTLTASGATTYTWSPSAGLSSTTGASVTATPTTTTTYVVTGSNGCGTSTYSVVVNVNPAPPDLAGVNQTVCAGNCVKIGAPGLPFLTYSWTPATGLAPTTSPTPTACPTVTTTYFETITDITTGCKSTYPVTVTVDPTPTVTVTSPIACGTGNIGTATATVTGSTGPYVYNWSPSGGAGSTATGLAAGHYIVTVISATGCVGTGTVNVVVDPIPGDFAGPNQTICSGSCVHIGSTIGLSGLSYTWSPTTALVPTTGLYPDACPTVTTVYSETVTDKATGCSSVHSVTVTVNPSPTVTVTSPIACGTGNIGTATATVTGGVGPYTYAWSPTGGNNSTATGLAAGHYVVTVTGSNGCVGTATVNVVVDPIPGDFAGPNQTICSGSCVHIGSTIGLSGLSYTWSPTTALVPTTGLYPDACPTVTTVYSETVTDKATGCSSVHSVTVTVNPSPTVTVTSPIACGTGKIGTATATVTGGVGPYTYAWSPTGGNSSTATGLAAGHYVVTVTGSNGCVGTATVNVVVDPLPGDFAGPNQTICSGSCVNIGSKTVPFGYSFSWSPTTGLFPTTSFYPQACPTVTTTYFETVTNNTTKCSSTYPVTVTVIQPPATPVISGNLNACTNAAGTYAVTNVVSGATYTWTASGGTPSSGTGSSASVNFYSAGGTITFTATSTVSGCTLSSSATFTVPPCCSPATPIITGNLYACTNGTTPYSVTDVVTGANYSWTASGGTPSSGTGSTANVNFYSGGGTITFTAINPGCQFPSMATYTISPCCQPANGTPALVINNQTASSIGPVSNYAIYTDQTIYINGTFTVDQDVTFDMCEVYMGPLAKIDVLPGVTLQIGNQNCTHIQAGCGEMWDGIYIEPGAYVFTGGIGDVIEDAENGIVAKNSATAQGIYQLVDAFFNKNHVSIQVEPLASGVYQGYVYNCAFTCRDLSSIDPLITPTSTCPDVSTSSWQGLPMKTLLPPYAGQRSSIGILVDQVSQINIVGVGLTPVGNYFDNMDNGIVSLFSNIDIQNQSFTHINSSNTADAGIVAVGGIFSLPQNTLNVGSVRPENVFTDCTNGIIAEDAFSSVNINNNIFNFQIPATNSPSTTRAIWIDQTGGAGTDVANIKNNNISSAYVGIECDLNANINADIRNNTITGAGLCSTSPNEIGIVLDETGAPTTAFYNASTNTISGLHYGISANSIYGAYLDNNTITLDQGTGVGCAATLAGYGISLVNGNSCSISSNTISTSFVAATQAYQGIYTSTSPNSSLCGNTITGMSIGMGFDANEANSVITTNSINVGGFAKAIGMNFTHTCVVGIQGSATQPNFNTWNGVFSCNSSLDPSTAVPANRVKSIFFVQTGVVYNPVGGSGGCTQLLTSPATGGTVPACTPPPPVIKPRSNGQQSTPSSEMMADPIVTNMLAEHTVADSYLGNVVNKQSRMEQDQLYVLRSIARECPYINIDVYRSRAILTRFDGANAYNNSCEESGVVETVKDITDASQLDIYPNPNNGTFTLDYNLEENSTGTVRVFDLMGNVLGQYELKDSVGKMTISNPNLVNGIYIYELRTNNNVVKVGKIIIIK